MNKIHFTFSWKELFMVLGIILALIGLVGGVLFGVDGLVVVAFMFAIFLMFFAVFLEI